MSPTRNDVAIKAGVSQATVSNVINNIPTVDENIRRKVLQSIQELGYVPNEAARNLRLGRKKETFNVGCQLFLNTDENRFADPYYGKILKGLDEEAIKHGYNLFFNYTTAQFLQNRELFRKMVNSEKIDGLVTIGNPREAVEREFLAEAREKVRNIVCLGITDFPEVKGYDNISIDFTSLGYSSIDHLAKCGHSRIGLIIGHMRETGNSRCMELDEMEKKEPIVKSCIEAFEKNSVAYDRGLVKYSTVDGPDTAFDGYDEMSALLGDAQPPTAVFVMDDGLAPGVVRAVEGKGLKVPDDVSVLVFGDAASCGRPLDTVNADLEEMGRAGFRRFYEKKGQADMKPVKILLPVEIAARGSVRKK